MQRRLIVIGVLALALVPSLDLAWTNRDSPHFGQLHDDGNYLVVAKSLAEGTGYRLMSLPDQPYQTRYPPLYPLLLSLVWSINPAFPENLALAMMLSWVLLPLTVAIAWRVFRQLGFSEMVSLALSAAIAISPYYAYFSFTLMSELLFLSLLLAALLVAEEDDGRVHLALLAGALAGLAYLTRAAALPLLVTTPLVYILRRRYRQAALFAAAMLPAVLGWMLWVRAHPLNSDDPTMLWYGSYSAFYLYNVTLRDLPGVVVTNCAVLFAKLGRLLIFNYEDAGLGLFGSHLLGVIGTMGVVRLARRRGLFHYVALAVGYIPQLILYNYPPSERGLLPLHPLLLAGLATEAGHMGSLARTAWNRRKQGDLVFAGGVAVIFLAVAGIAGWQTWFGHATYFPSYIARERSLYPEKQRAYAWIQRSIPPKSTFLTYADPAFYLHTQQAALGIHVPTKFFYSGDRASLVRYYYSLAEFARRHRLRYLFYSPTDYEGDLTPSERVALRKLVDTSPDFEPLYVTNTVAVYRIQQTPLRSAR